MLAQQGTWPLLYPTQFGRLPQDKEIFFLITPYWIPACQCNNSDLCQQFSSCKDAQGQTNSPPFCPPIQKCPPTTIAHLPHHPYIPIFVTYIPVVPRDSLPFWFLFLANLLLLFGETACHYVNCPNLPLFQIQLLSSPDLKNLCMGIRYIHLILNTHLRHFSTQNDDKVAQNFSPTVFLHSWIHWH